MRGCPGEDSRAAHAQTHRFGLERQGIRTCLSDSLRKSRSNIQACKPGDARFFAVPAVAHLKSGFCGKYLRFLLLVCSGGFDEALQAPLEGLRYCSLDRLSSLNRFGSKRPAVEGEAESVHSSRNRKKFPKIPSFHCATAEIEKSFPGCPRSIARRQKSKNISQASPLCWIEPGAYGDGRSRCVSRTQPALGTCNMPIAGKCGRMSPKLGQPGATPSISDYNARVFVHTSCCVCRHHRRPTQLEAN